MHLSNILISLFFCHVSLLHESFYEYVSALLYGAAGRPTELLVAFLVDQIVLDHFLLLRHAVMHLDLMVLVSAPRVMHADDAVFLIALKLIAIQELCLLVPVAEEQGHGTALLALTLSLGAILHHGSHRRDACPQPDHDLRLLMPLRDGDTSRIHVAGQLLVSSVVPQEVHCHTMSVLILVVVPVVLDDAKLNLVANHSIGTGDGLQAWLDGGYVVNELLHVGHGRRLACQQVSLGHLLFVS